MILFDTNIFIYARNTDDPRYEICRNHILRVEKNGNGVISSQNIAEFASVSLKIIQINKKTIRDNIHSYLEFLSSGCFKIIYPNNQTISLFNSFLVKYQTSSKKVFDLFLIATMLSNGVNQILTYNYKDYSQFPEIKTIIPS